MANEKTKKKAAAAIRQIMAAAKELAEIEQQSKRRAHKTKTPPEPRRPHILGGKQ